MISGRTGRSRFRSANSIDSSRTVSIGAYATPCTLHSSSIRSDRRSFFRTGSPARRTSSRSGYTRTLLVHQGQTVERSGPYRFVRHPGYLGSLLCLNGIAPASGSALVFVASLAATSAAYAYRVRVEDAMLVAAFGESYESYRREVGDSCPSSNEPVP